MSRSAAVEAILDEKRQHLNQVVARRTAAEALARAKRAAHAAAVDRLESPAMIRTLHQEATETEAEEGGYADAVTRLEAQIEAMGPDLRAARIADAEESAAQAKQEAAEAVTLLGEKFASLLRKNFLPELTKVQAKLELAEQAIYQQRAARGQEYQVYTGISSLWANAPGLEPLIETLTDYAEGGPAARDAAARARMEQQNRAYEKRRQAEAEAEASARQYAQIPVEERNRQARQSLGVQ
jgi:hypothetical protein